jgi:hypothetical protein
MQQSTQIGPGCCEFCREQLYRNNDPLAFTERTENLRWLCCGKGFHNKCWQKETLAKGGSLEDHAKLQRIHRCPLCNAHTASFKKKGKMIKSLKKWVKKKKSWAVMDLAVMTYFGDGVPQNKPKAIKMLEKAIASGDANAMAWLGRLFGGKLHDGEELEPQQTKQMMELLTRAASLNHPHALTNLGSMYWNGFGVNACKDKAIEYTARAAELNNQTAIENLELFKQQPNHHQTMCPLQHTLGPQQQNNGVPVQSRGLLRHRMPTCTLADAQTRTQTVDESNGKKSSSNNDSCPSRL